MATLYLRVSPIILNECIPIPADVLPSVQALRAISDSAHDLRQRELVLFAVDRNSPVGTRLAAVRGEFPRLLAGQAARLEINESAVRFRPDHIREDAESQAVEPACTEVVAGG
jgi:hypothetical protein